MIKNTLNEHTRRLDINTVSSLQTVNMVSDLVLVQPYYDDLSLNATQLLVKI